MKRRSKKPKIELPNCILSNIFSRLGLKDLVKTRTLSKQWLQEWGLRTDHNFDVHNMFDLDYSTIQESQESRPLFEGFQFEFARRLDQFMLHYQGAMIRSIRVNFPLGTKHNDVINRMISKGIAKGVDRIELLFSYETIDLDKIESYKFSFTLLSHTDCLTYLHLQNCHLVGPMDLSGFKNLRTLVLQLVDVEKNLLQGLFSNCIHLVDFTLDNCDFKSNLKITSPTLLHLNIVNCGDRFGRVRRNIDIIASNLSSIEYSFNSNYPLHLMKIKAHMLSKFSFRGSQISSYIGGQYHNCFEFSELKNVTTIVLDGIHDFCLRRVVMPLLFSECHQLEDLTFKNCKQMRAMNIISPKLLHLKIIDCGYSRLHSYPIHIDALNLSSFEYSCHTATGDISVTAPSLLKVFWNAAKREKNPSPFGPIARLRHIENLSMIISTSQVAELKKVLIQCQNLRQLELYIEGTYHHSLDYFWILDIAMASQHLQKLSLTIKNLHLEKSHMGRFQRRIRKYAKFFHNDLKYVELRGCVCSKNVIELARHLLRKANSLKQITFSSRNKFYIGAGTWTNGSNDCCWFERNLIHKMLKDEVREQCQLIIL